MENRHVAILYMPVFHKGYFDFFETLREKKVTKLYVVSDEILESHEALDYLNRKDTLRALQHSQVVSLLKNLGLFETESLRQQQIKDLQDREVTIHTPREDINVFLVEKYFGGKKIEYYNVFLRRNMNNVGEVKRPDVERLNANDFQKKVFSQILKESEKSADWWRQVGAALVKDRKVIAVAHNEHMPEKELPNIEGDSRALYKKGININYVTSAHAEVGVLGRAAREGLSTDGAELFVTDFPCPYCARLIVASGIKTLYFIRGYAVLDGDEFLKKAGVEVWQVTG